MTSTTENRPTADLLVRASAIAREHALWADENRRLHDEVITALREAGVFTMRVPTQHGGAEVDAATLLRTLVEIGRGDGSASWLTAVWSTCAWITGLYPDHVQDEVFSTPDVRVCGVLSPTATAVPSAGGIVVDGAWNFISGAHHSQWQLVLAMAPTPDGTAQWPVMALVPMSDLEVVDDWHTAGLRGTGSVTTVANGVFVPADRVLPMVALLQGRFASELNADKPMFRAPLIATGCVSFAGAALGLAKTAMETFLERLPERKITYTDYAAQREAPLTHLQLAEATFKIDEAEFHATRLAAMLDDKGALGEPWTVHDRVTARALLGRVLGLAKDSVDILYTASGGSAVYSGEAIQRVIRDVQTLNLHALMHPNTNFELYGRVLAGLEPNTTYL